ncbi:hypothetical protein, conserved [Plasmodium gonderi]|uniref:Asparagine-rich protein n=1 Tax=Plasmodium gonderi TaxID=77519 RepID=A0A1Y1JJ48_PLAGO|nr:hypothetical protein, conserved [Plasmodium gonderi]GAW82529.1 hypothetical protein, conserved [Plasmodium gonderi]
MASSQIRQFATIIDQLPCEADDFKLMDNFEDYNNRLESSIRNNKGKKTDTFFHFKPNLSDYTKNISNSSTNINCGNTNTMMKKSSSSNENGSSNIENIINLQNKTIDEENSIKFNGSNMKESETNSFTHNDPGEHIHKQNLFDEKDVSKNIMDSFNHNNTLFVYDNDLTKDERSNYIETLNSEIDENHYKYETNEGKALCKKNIIELIHCNNECLSDMKFSTKMNSCSLNNKDNNNSSNNINSISSNNNYDVIRNNADVSMYNFSTSFNDKSCEDNNENIVYRYNVNTLPSKHENYINKKKGGNFKKDSLPNKDKENEINQLIHNSKNLPIPAGERKMENTQNHIQFTEEKSENSEKNDGRINECTNINNIQSPEENNNKSNGSKDVNVQNSTSENSTEIEYKDFCDMLKKSDEFNKNILFSKKAKVIKLDANKSLIIFPVNIHEYGDKYIAINQKDLLEYISSSIEMDNEDLSSLKIKNYQKEKELQNIKVAYSMQTTNIHYLINRVIFKECEYENLKNKSLTLEQEINKLIQEINSLINQNKEGLYMQKAFIDYKCKCVLKLQELQPHLGDYYYDIFNYITSCRTLGQLSIWIPAFETKTESLESIANNLIKIMLNGLGAPFNSSPQYFLSNKKLMNKSISIESEEDTFINNLAKRKIIDNYLVNSLNSFNTTKENNSHFSNCHSFSLNSEESSSFLGTEELFFNSSKFPSMHSVATKNNNDNNNANSKDNSNGNNSSLNNGKESGINYGKDSNSNAKKKKSKKTNILNNLNRSSTTEKSCIDNELHNNNDVNNIRNIQEFSVTNVQEQKHKLNAEFTSKEILTVKRKQTMINNEEKDIKKMKLMDKTTMNKIDLNHENLKVRKSEDNEVKIPTCPGDEIFIMEKSYGKNNPSMGHKIEANIYDKTRDNIEDQENKNEWCQKTHMQECNSYNEEMENENIINAYNSIIEKKGVITNIQNENLNNENIACDDIIEDVQVNIPNMKEKGKCEKRNNVEEESDEGETVKGE